MDTQNIRIYYGDKFKYAHERRALKRFLWTMFDFFGSSNRLYYVVIEPNILGGTPDLLLMNDCSLIVVDFKELINVEKDECDQVQLHGNVNSSWAYHLPDGRVFQMGDPFSSKNPYTQVRGYRFSFASWLHTHATSIFGGELSKKQVQNMIHAWIAISPGYDGDWENTIDLSGEHIKFSTAQKTEWFNIVPLDSLAGDFDCPPYSRTQFTESQLKAVIEYLGVKPLDNYREFVQEYPWISPIFRAPRQLENIIDRKIEVGSLLSALEDPQITTIAVQGLPGSGKTAIAARIVHEIKNSHYRVRWIDCREKTGISLGSILSALSTEVTGLDRSFIRDQDQPLSDRLELLCKFLNHRPTLIVLDDFHLLENRMDIQRFIEQADRHHNVKFLLTSSIRVQDFTWLPESSRVIDTGAIPKENIPDFINIYTQDVLLTPQEYDIVWRKLSGNPQALRLSIPLIRQFSWTHDISQLPLPESPEFFDYILGTISEGAKQLALKLSVFRVSIPFDMIQLIAGSDAGTTLKLTNELVDKYILEVHPTTRLFKMVELIAQYLLDRGPLKTRRELHRKAGEAFRSIIDGTGEESLKVEYLVEAIYHFQQGGPRSQLLSCAEQVYDLLRGQGDLDRSQSVAQAALSTAQDIKDNRIIVPWIIRLAEIALRREERDEFTTLSESAIGITQAEISKPSKQENAFWIQKKGHLMYLRGRNAYAVHDYPSALDYLETGLQAAEESADPETRANCLVWMARVERQQKLYDLAIPHIQQSLAIAEAHGYQFLIWDCLSYLAVIARSQGDYENAEAYFSRMYGEVKLADNTRLLEYVLGNLGRTKMMAGKYNEAEKYLLDCLAMTRQYQLSRGLRITLTNLVELYIRSNRITDAEQLLPESIERNNHAKDRIGIAWNYKHRGQVRKAQGFKDEGNQLILQGKSILEELGNKEYLAEFEESLRAHQQLQLDFKQAGEKDGEQSP